VNETSPPPANAEPPTSSVAGRSRRAMQMLIGGGLVVLAAAAWAIFAYRNGVEKRPELLTYRLCVGLEQTPCPSDAAFVQDAGEDTVSKWAQQQCAGYKARRIIINDGPSKECDCYLADVRCSSE
jgi:hypothetical protein